MISKSLSAFSLLSAAPLTLLALSPVAVSAAPAQSEDAAAPARQDDAKGGDNTTKRAGEIVTQPVRDVGIDKKKVPPILAQAVEAPYARPGGKGCAAITHEMTQLNAVLGPDFGQGTEENESKIGKVADVGGSAIVNSLIPLRGLVREVSGAAPADRRFAAAVSAGMARRGYLRGLVQWRGCAVPKTGTAKKS
ncbi:MAG TPA: hypothetical protein VF503_03075 [Sphingobium sp.]|uniref:hypothetical protein n=1 Tax=Sphingobium sp. TaxID=1912891 RepID=UPI002ED38B9F